MQKRDGNTNICFMETSISLGTCTQTRIAKYQLHGGKVVVLFFLFFKKRPSTMLGQATKIHASPIPTGVPGVSGATGNPRIQFSGEVGLGR